MLQHRVIRNQDVGRLRQHFLPCQLPVIRDAVPEQLTQGGIGSEHVLLGLLHAEGGARDLLAARGVTLDGMRSAVEGLGRGEASG